MMKSSYHFVFFLISFLVRAEESDISLSGPAFTNPTNTGENELIIQGNFEPNSSFFVFRGIQSLYYNNLVPYYYDDGESARFAAVTSSLTMIESTSGNETFRLNLSALHWSKNHTNTIFIFKAVLNKSTVTVFPPNNFIKGPIPTNDAEKQANQTVLFNKTSNFTRVFGASPSSFGSIMYRQIIGTQEEIGLNCSLRIRLQGRAYLYLDGAFIGVANSILDDDEILFLSSERFLFWPSEYRMLEVYGISLIVHSIELIECIDRQNGDKMGTDPAITFAALSKEVFQSSTPPLNTIASCGQFGDCDYCTDYRCIRCNNDLLTFEGKCYSSTDPSGMMTLEECSYGSVMNNSLISQSILRNTTLSNGTFEADIFEPFPEYSEESYARYALIFHSGAGTNKTKCIFPRKLTQNITTSRIDGDSLEIEAKPTGATPLTFYILVFRNNEWSSHSILIQYQMFTDKPSPSDVLGMNMLTSYSEIPLTPDFWYATVSYYTPGDDGSKIYFQLNTNDPVETYINGVRHVTNSSAWPVEDDINPPEAPLYFVVHIFKAAYGEFKIGDLTGGVEADSQLAKGYTDLPKFPLEYHICADGLVFDEFNFKCVQATKCSAGTYITKEKCLYPCIHELPSNIDVLNCKARLLLSGSAIENPTTEEDELILTNVEHLEKGYFGYRTLDEFSGLPFLPSSYSVFYATALRKLEPTSRPYQLQTALASIGYSNDAWYTGSVLETKKGGWFVMGSSLNDTILSPIKFENTGRYRALEVSIDTVSKYNTDEFVFGDGPNAIPGSPFDFGSIVAVRIIGLGAYASNLDDDLMCKIKFRFNGLIFIYLQTKLIGITPFVATDKEGIYISERAFQISKKDFQVLHLFTRWTDTLEMGIVECTTMRGNQISYEPKLDSYSTEDYDSALVRGFSINENMPAKNMDTPENCNYYFDQTGYCHECASGNNDFSTGQCTLPSYRIFSANGSTVDQSTISWDSEFLIPLNPSESIELKNLVNVRNMQEIIWSSNITTLKVENYLTSGANNSLYLPNCTLKPGVWYGLTLSFFQLNDIDPTNYTFGIPVNSESIRPVIICEEEHSYLQDLKISGSFVSTCPPFERPQYMWGCKVSNDSGATFNQCNDFFSLFGHNSTNNSLVIPEHYFNKNQYLQINLTIRYLGRSNSTTTVVRITEAESIDMELLCLNCKPKFSGNHDLQLQAAINSSINSQSLTFSWDVNPSMLYYSFRTLSKIYSQGIPLENSMLQVKLTIFNDTHRGYDIFEIPLNHPPNGGIIKVIPNFGYSLFTQFDIWCSNWIDEDIPLSYQLIMSYDEEFENARQLSPEQETPYINTYLSALPPSSSIFIKAIVRDSYKSKSEASIQIEVESKSNNLVEAISSSDGLLETLLSSNSSHEQIIQMISVIAQELLNFESIQYDASKNPCPKCGNHGSCNEVEVCLCEKDWTLPDCTMTTKDFDKMIELKLEMLNQLGESYSDLNDPAFKEMLINDLERLSNPPFNTNKTLSKMKKFLDDYIDLSNSETVLDKSQAASIAQTLSNMIEYASESDCRSETEYNKILGSMISQYLDTISTNTLNSLLPNEDPNIIQTKVLDILTAKGTPCFFSETPLGIDENTPTITILPKNKDNLDCEEVYNLQFYAIQDDLFNCSIPSYEKSKTKSSVAIKIQNSETLQNAASLFFMEMIMPKGKSCPKDCSSKNGKCLCEDLSVFDPKGQFTSIFEKSNLALITKVDSLLEWKFWSSFAFWALLFVTFFYIFTLDLLTKGGMARACVVKELQKKNPPSRLDIIRASFLVAHRLSNIFAYDNKLISKRKRATLYYLRLLIMLAFASIFKTKGSGGSIINPYMLILPYFTVIPIISLLQWLVIDPPSKKRKRLVIDPPPKMRNMIKPKEVTESSPVNSKSKKIRKIIAYLLVSLSILGSIFVIFVIDANIEDDEKSAWRATFFFILGQDVLVTPIIFLILQYLFIKATTSASLREKNPKFVDFIETKLVDDNLAFIKVKRTKLPPDVITRNLEKPTSTAMTEAKHEMSSLASLKDNSVNSMSQIDDDEVEDEDEEEFEPNPVAPIETEKEVINARDQSAYADIPLNVPQQESETFWNPMSIMTRTMKKQVPVGLPLPDTTSIYIQSPSNANFKPEGLDVLTTTNIALSPNENYSPSILGRTGRVIAKSPFLQNFSTKSNK